MQRTLPRRYALHALAGLALSTSLLAALPANAQAPAWPAKPVKFINNFPPGGPSDVLARSVADVLQSTLKQPFVVENKAGAGGNIGADAVAKSPADGTTVLFGIDTTFTVNPHIYKGMPFKPSDLKPVMVMASSGLLVGVHPGTGFKTLPDLIAALEAEQKEIADLLADGSLYAIDNARALKLATRSAQIDDELLTALERWELLGAAA
mgnify:CR=1 FL=1